MYMKNDDSDDFNDIEEDFGELSRNIKDIFHEVTIKLHLVSIVCTPIDNGYRNILTIFITFIKGRLQTVQY